MSQIPLIETHEETGAFRTEHLAYAAYIATHRMTRVYGQLLAPLGLTYAQYLVMIVLWQQSPRSVGEIASVLALDSGTLTPLLKRMQTAGLLERKRDPEDERRVLVRPTALGASLNGKAAGIAEEMRRIIPLTEERAEAIHDDLLHIARSLT